MPGCDVPVDPAESFGAGSKCSLPVPASEEGMELLLELIQGGSMMSQSSWGPHRPWRVPLGDERDTSGHLQAVLLPRMEA